MAAAGLDVMGTAKIALTGAAAGFALGEAVLLAVDPVLLADGRLGSVAAMATVVEKVGSTGLAGLIACLVFAATFFSLGVGFHLASLLMASLVRLGGPAHGSWLVDSMGGAFTAAGAVAAGVLGGLVPAWCSLGVQCVLALSVYIHCNVNETATALLVIYVTLHASAVLGRMGLLVGLVALGMTVSFVVGLHKFLRQRWTPPPPSEAPKTASMLGMMSLRIVVVTLLGFPMGLGLGGGLGGGEVELASLLGAVLWVGILFAPLLGASLGTIGTFNLGPQGAGRAAVAATVTSCLALGAVLPMCSPLGARSSLGGILGVAAVTGLSLAAARVALQADDRATNVTLVAILVGVTLGVGHAALTTAIPWYEFLTSAVTVSLVATMAFFCGAPRSPFRVQWGLGTGAELLRQLGKETVATGAAPFGAGALGAAALGTSALGGLGAAGVAVAVLLALGKTLKSMAEQRVKAEEEERDTHRD
ncbi:hypothetical protein CRUP_021938 [Coryphaenoides rupestris]|nr:hypothetical protein CRUP_021938 [Coryphaenoides rupestris]